MHEMQAEMIEFECCPQCVGCLLEALAAAGVPCDTACTGGAGSMEGSGCGQDGA